MIRLSALPLPFLFLLIGVFLPASRAQIPLACVQNVTRVNATCCPSIPGDATAAPCGGPRRGRCVALEVLLNGTKQVPKNPLPAVNDNRMNWPIHLFQHMCQCSFFYSGLACEDSYLQFGPGKGNPFKNFFNPTSATKRVRRDIRNLTKAEREHVRDVLARSKYESMEWVVINDTASAKNPDGTPRTTFFNMSVYDFFVYVNYYATKGVSFNSSAPSTPMADMGHGGPNFIPYHRWFLNDIELVLDTISRNITLTKNPAATAIPPFAFPYWNWTDQVECDACTDDLLGAITADGEISPASPFASWRVLCDNEEPSWHPCDPNGKRPLLRRSYGEDPRHDTLPTAEEVNFALKAPNFDVAPYNESSNSSSFRNLLEGYIGPDNNATAAKLGQRYMGMKVRHFLTGTWTDLALGANDPLFWLHQAFLDKLYEDWKAAAPPGATDMPPDYVARPGENRSENLTPFFAPVQVSRVLFGNQPFASGYSYDVVATASPSSAEGIAKKSIDTVGQPSAFSASSTVAVVVAVAAVVAAVAVFATFFQRRRRAYREVKVLSFEPTERQPLLTHSTAAYKSV